MKTSSYYPIIIKSTFKQLERNMFGIFSSPNSFGKDELGEYFYFKYPLEDKKFWYEHLDAIVDEWTQECLTLPNVKFREVDTGFDKDQEILTIMFMNGNIYLLRNVRVLYSLHAPEFIFNSKDFTAHVKTQKSLKAVLNKLEVDKLEI